MERAYQATWINYSAKFYKPVLWNLTLNILSLCRPILFKTGIFYQLRVDMGREWVLILFIQELLSGYRQNQDRQSHVKTTSKQNLTIERVWPEVNARVYYPIKRILVDLEEKGILDMNNECIQFCVSHFTCQVAKVGMQRFVDAWNFHRMKGWEYVHVLTCLSITWLFISWFINTSDYLTQNWFPISINQCNLTSWYSEPIIFYSKRGRK